MPITTFSQHCVAYVFDPFIGTSHENILSKEQAVKKICIGRTLRICIYALGPTELASVGETKDNKKFGANKGEA